MLRYGIDKDRIDFCETKCLGDWNRNVKRKIAFFLLKCEEYQKQGLNVAWIDADAEVQDTEYKKCGIALPFYESFNGEWGMSYEYNAQMSRHGFLSNAFVFRACDKAHSLLEKWEEYTIKVQSRTPTQAAFKHMWNEWGINQCIKFIEQPTGYVWYDAHKNRRPYNQCQPIIKHDIASRRMHRKH
jgi:hypothetical protein